MDFILPESDGLRIEYFGHLFDNTSECSSSCILYFFEG